MSALLRSPVRRERGAFPTAVLGTRPTPPAMGSHARPSRAGSQAQDPAMGGAAPGAVMSPEQRGLWPWAALLSESLSLARPGDRAKHSRWACDRHRGSRPRRRGRGGWGAPRRGRLGVSSPLLFPSPPPPTRYPVPAPGATRVLGTPRRTGRRSLSCNSPVSSSVPAPSKRRAVSSASPSQRPQRAPGARACSGDPDGPLRA